ncbi:uncharacterized protein LAJ45_07496 [Morchella importuna]|uniref:uncharacterized protein n=1 Tax=Morchella importuna TaxID=1174673 RepID=UPI001E8E596F|nr:uncharacterized protein LAJ45_07496 [Morchella importuna]KAH8148394.1 hypothetical protein LAJ45_07496 [Morchella importuna]
MPDANSYKWFTGYDVVSGSLYVVALFFTWCHSVLNLNKKGHHWQSQFPRRNSSTKWGNMLSIIAFPILARVIVYDISTPRTKKQPSL